MKTLEEMRNEKDRAMLVAEAALADWKEAIHLRKPRGGKRGLYYAARKNYLVARNTYLLALGRTTNNETEELT